jgi:putative transposase
LQYLINVEHTRDETNYSKDCENPRVREQIENWIRRIRRGNSSLVVPKEKVCCLCGTRHGVGEKSGRVCHPDEGAISRSICPVVCTLPLHKAEVVVQFRMGKKSGELREQDGLERGVAVYRDYWRKRADGIEDECYEVGRIWYPSHHCYIEGIPVGLVQSEVVCEVRIGRTPIGRCEVSVVRAEQILDIFICDLLSYPRGLLSDDQSHLGDAEKCYESSDPEDLKRLQAEFVSRNGAERNQVCFVLKYSPSTALTASGTVSSFLAFRSASNALSMSSDTDSIIFFIAISKSPMPLDMHRYLYRFLCWICIDRYWYMATVTVLRIEKGRAISEKPNQIQRLDERFYKVASQTRDLSYDVTRQMNDAWLCTCPDFQYRNAKCKHIWAVEFSLRLRDKVKEHVVLEPVVINACIFCKSEAIIKDGLRHNQYGDIQKFNCKACGHYFTVNLGFERMKHNPQGITTAMQLYFSGESLRNTAMSLRLLGVQVTYQTVWNWIQKYTELMEKYLDKITPQVSDVWRADELFLKVKGSMKYLYAMMDDETRFWIATEVANTKYTADLKPLLSEAMVTAGKQPKALITDGAKNFAEACRTEYYSRWKSLRTEHIRDIRMDGTVHNNKMERMNGEIRDREKVMRSLKTADTPIIAGLQIFHNYVRPHMALDGRTPADLAGIDIQGENKWLTLIQNAASQPTKIDNDKSLKEPTST